MILFSVYFLNNRKKYIKKIKSFHILYSFQLVQRKWLFKELISLAFVLLIISGVLYFSTVFKLSTNLEGNQKIMLSIIFFAGKLVHSFCNNKPDRIHFLAEGILNFDDASITSYRKLKIEKINKKLCKIFLRNIETNESYAFVVGNDSEIGFSGMIDFLQTKTNISSK
jgi:hypothetical protein